LLVLDALSFIFGQVRPCREALGIRAFDGSGEIFIQRVRRLSLARSISGRLFGWTRTCRVCPFCHLVSSYLLPIAGSELIGVW